MGRLQNGPDWTDILRTLWNLEEHHSVSITLLVTVGSAFGGLPASYDVIAVPKKLDDPWEPMGWTVTATWPCATYATPEGTIYAALLKMDDLLCDKRWTQLNITL